MALKTNPDFVEAARRYDLGRYEEAERFAQQGIERAPGDPGCYYIMALLAAKGGKKRQALELLEKAKSLGGRPAQYHHFAAMVQIRLGKVKVAESEILASIREGPNLEGPHTFYAAILEARRDYPAALRELDISLKLNPTSEAALGSRVRILTVLGRREEAVESSLALLRLRPDSSNPHEAAGLVALAKGDSPAAFESFREALRLDPNSDSARAGALDALRSRYAFYRRYYAFSLWLKSKPAWWGTLFIPIAQVSSALMRSPQPLPVRMLGVALLAVFGTLAVFRIFSEPVADAMLLFTPLGRELLSRSAKYNGAALGTLVVLGLVSVGCLLIGYPVVGLVVLVFAAVCCIVLLIIGMGKREALKALGWLGFALVAAIVLCVVMISVFHVQ